MNLTHEPPLLASAAPTRSPDRPHVIVIGSGFGGLAAAIRMGAKGYRVTILEKLDKLGGRAYVYERDGFKFDAGPTIITGRFLLDELWEMCGRRIEDDVDLRDMSPFYRIRFNDGSTFECSADTAEVHKEIAKFSPGDVEGYDRLMAMSEKIYEFGFAKLGMIPFGEFSKMAAAVPGLLRLKAYRTVYGLVSTFIKDERLRIAFSFHPLLIGGSPFRAPSTYCLITYLEKTWGVQFAMGGMGSLVQGLAGLVRRQGGVIRTSAEVREILIENGAAKGVMLKGGDVLKSDLVISNADAAGTYKHLIPSRWRKRWTDKKLNRMHYSMSLFVWYFGTNRRYEDVAHHMILMGPRYKGHLKAMFRDKTLAEDFSLYLHRPTATDPSMAPEGCDSFYALSPVPHQASGTDWQATGESYRAKIQQFLEDTVLPGLGGHVVTSHFVTPEHFQTALASVQGAGFGFEPLPQQAGWFRPHNRSEDIENLYLVGGGTHPGAGIPGVIASAKVLEHLIPGHVR